MHYTTHGTYSFTSHPKDEAIIVKCLAQGHKRRDRPGRDSNPHSGFLTSPTTPVQCTRPLGHDTPEKEPVSVICGNTMHWNNLMSTEGSEKNLWLTHQQHQSSALDRSGMTLQRKNLLVWFVVTPCIEIISYEYWRLWEDPLVDSPTTPVQCTRPLGHDTPEKEPVSVICGDTMHWNNLMSTEGYEKILWLTHQQHQSSALDRSGMTLQRKNLLVWFVVTPCIEIISYEYWRFWEDPLVDSPTTPVRCTRPVGHDTPEKEPVSVICGNTMHWNNLIWVLKVLRRTFG